MKVTINKSDCVIEKPVAADEAAMYKSMHGAACEVVLEPGDDGYCEPTAEEPQPADVTTDIPPAPGDAEAGQAGAIDTVVTDTTALGEAVVIDGVIQE